MSEIREKLIKCLDKNGISYRDDFREIDSISIITAIVDIEQDFGIEFPDEYLIMERMSDFEKLLSVVKLILNET